MAFIHASYQLDSGMPFYERMEFLGSLRESLAQIRQARSTRRRVSYFARHSKIQPPKFFCDMIKSLIGAILFDSGGSVDVVRVVVTHLGIMAILEHIVNADVDILHPGSRLSLWTQKNGGQIDCNSRKEGGHMVCSVLVDGVKEVEVLDEWRGKLSREEMKFTAGEKATKAFRPRDVVVEYELLKKKKEAGSKSRG
ncbi:unnamed protein product [Cyclocybe aegerita]|uniref:Uncharacterized protein n=1 Tax=Cyclocybe aegerita TaxID=1973307 RepID=A0A8S0VRA0_CYCAE|nr:unnamed protein product [Cyclocybe aegerita]